MVFFSILALALLAGVFKHPLRSGAELLGLAVGVPLAVRGLRLTKFEVTPQGLYYTPNTHIGIALSLLFAVRLVYRLAQLYLVTGALQEATPQAFLRTPLTLLLIGTLAGYYACYAAGLLRWAHAASRARRAEAGAERGA